VPPPPSGGPPPPPGEPLPVTPEQAPVGDPTSIPQVAPVGEAPPAVTPVQAPVSAPSTTPREAPVTAEAQRATQGVELTKFILLILGGSIVLLIAYLSVLDYKTSAKVDQIYDRILAAIEPPLASPEITQINGVLATLRAFE
jgi:hypothetical protein